MHEADAGQHLVWVRVRLRVRVRDRDRVRVRDRDRVRDRVRVRRLGVLLKVDAHGPLAEVDEQVHRQRGHADACMG